MANSTLLSQQHPVDFFFTVHLFGQGEDSSSPAGASFQEVSGLSVSLETKEITESEQNRLSHRIPSLTRYENLVLKRGVLLPESTLAIWCRKTLINNLNEPAEPKTLLVSLLDVNASKAIMSWRFTNAYPIKWSLSPLNTPTGEILAEEIEFIYSYFERLETQQQEK